LDEKVINLIGPFVVAPLWGFLSTELFLQGWLAYADMFIAIASLVRGRTTGSRAAEAAFGALVTGVACTACLHGGFWVLLEVMGFGRRGLEKILYCVFVVLSAAYLVPRLPSKVQKAWRTAMSPDAAKEATATDRDGAKGR
jgi:hypothetical protein